KIIHDDDWLAHENSLSIFADAADGDTKVIFSAFNSFQEATRAFKQMKISQRTFRRLQNNPYQLFVRNVLGPPSTLMYHSSISEFFELSLKWVVDFEGYIRLLKSYPAKYVGQSLMCCSVSDTQITASCLNNPQVEIPESLFLYQRYGKHMTSNLL